MQRLPRGPNFDEGLYLSTCAHTLLGDAVPSVFKKRHETQRLTLLTASALVFQNPKSKYLLM